MVSPCPDPAARSPDFCHRKLCLHGLAVELSCSAEHFFGHLARILRPFMVDQLPPGFANTGVISVYSEEEVLRQLSTAAQKVPSDDPCLELYQDGERFWLIDERWGMCQINFLRGQWRSWVLPKPTADSLRVIEGAVLWPLAQLLRWRGLHLTPAIAVARQGWGALILSPLSLAGELGCLVERGYRIVGQRWTALRDEDGRIELLHLPGAVERVAAAPARRRVVASPLWVDVTADCPQAMQYHTFCDVVLLVDATRRDHVQASELSPMTAARMFSFVWPIADIHPTRRGGQLWPRLAQSCRCLKAQLSHDPADMPLLLDGIRQSERQSVARPTVFVRQSGSRILKAKPAA